MAGRLDEGRPSATAWKVALWRAAHQIADQPRVLDDPLAVKIIGLSGARALADKRISGRGPLALALRAFLAARARYAEDRLAAAYAQGVRQYVVLGAGLDTFAYRNPHDDLTVYEVDHPATQASKRARLDHVGIAVPETVVYAAVDFQTQGVAEGLAAAGFDASAPAVIAWLGVTPYLTEAAVFDTLAWIARLPATSEVVFDFVADPKTLGFWSKLILKGVQAWAASSGEPFRSRFDPEVLATRMRGLGFGVAEVIDAKALNALYFRGRADGMRVKDGGLRMMRGVV